MRERGLEKLPLIIPVVIYHGAEPWRVSEHFSALLDLENLPDAMQRYALDSMHYLLDLSKFKDTDLVGGAGLLATLQLMKHIFMGDVKPQLPQIFDTLVKQLPPTEAAERLNTMVRYIHETGRVTEQELLAALGESQQGEKYMETIRIDLFPAKLEMVREETGAMFTLHQLKQKIGTISKTTEARIRELEIPELLQLSTDLLNFNSRSDLTAWLRRHAPKKKAAKAATH
jgi:hypothetical protein